MQNKRAYFWTFIGRIIPQALNLLTTMILARFLSPADFGQIGVLSIFLMIANTLNDSGLGGALIQAKIVTKKDCSSIFVFNLGMSLILYLILFMFSREIENYFKAPGLQHVAQALGLVFVINSLGFVSRSLLYKNLKFKYITNSVIISVICASICSIILAINGAGVYSIVAFQLIQCTVNVILLQFGYPTIYQLSFDIYSLKRLLPFGLYTTIVSVIDTIYENIPTFIFGKIWNISQAGYLSQAKKLKMHRVIR